MISEATLTAIRDRTDIVRLVGEVVKLKRAGRNYTGLCPFHSDKNPSFSVNAERGFYHCFACKEHGSAIDFVMKLEGKTFPEAARTLAERAGIPVEDQRTDAERREEQAARRAVQDLYAVNAMAATFFEHSLTGGLAARQHPRAPEAIGELARRGLSLSDPQAAAALQAFRIGYAPAGWDALTSYLQKQGVSPVTAEKVGLVVPRSSGSGYYDRFRHRLMFAVLDVQGRVVAFSGRALPDTSTGEPPAKYINSPESPIYTKGEHLFGLYQARQAIRQKGEAVLVEGNFDVVALHARGMGHVVAPLGTAFTEHQARLLQRFAPSVSVMFDGDAAGRKATWAARGPCRVAGLSARSIALPKGSDPDEMARRGPAGLAEAMASAVPLTHRLLDWLLRDGEVEGAPVHDPAERARAAARLVAEGADDIERAMFRSYAAQLSAALGVDGVLTAMPRAARAVAAQRRSVADEMSEAVLGALLDCPSLLGDSATVARLDVLGGPAALAVALLRQMGTANPGALLAALPEAVREAAAHRLAAPRFQSEDEARRAIATYARTLRVAHMRQSA